MVQLWLLLIVQTIVGISLALPPGQLDGDVGTGLAIQDQDSDEQESSKSESPLGSLFRRPRQSRCIKCFHYYDERYPSPDYKPAYPSAYYAPRPQPQPHPQQYPPQYPQPQHGAISRQGYEDRSWYYYPDDRRYDERYYDRGYDDRYPGRTYDRYETRPAYYDRYETRQPPNYRGNGYDNRDRYYDTSRTYDGYYGSGGKCVTCVPKDRYYDRQRPVYDTRNDYDRFGGRYDNRNFRPWDETYRGISGFDNSGRGYWFASNPLTDTKPSSSSYYRPDAQPPPPQPPPQGSGYGGRPVEYGPRHPQPPPSPISPPNSSSQSTQTSSGGTSQQSSQGSAPSTNNQYNNRQPMPATDNDAKSTYNDNWAYDNNRNMGRGGGPNYDNRDNDIQSYGARRPPYGGSYLHDRENNAPVEIKDDQDVNAGKTMDNTKNADSSLTSSSMDEKKSH